MKTIRFLFAAGIFIILFTFTSFGAGKAGLSENSIKSLLMGVNSENFGLRTSCAQMLGDFQVKESVNSLLKMLHSEETEEGRIIAALALYKTGSERALFAVKRAAIFDDSERVRKLCAALLTANNALSEPVLKSIICS
jgi:HEAT repeat protein